MGILDDWFGIESSDPMADLFQQQLAESKKANELAAKTAEEARARAAAAMTPARDQESARKAAETRMRRLLGVSQPVLNLGAAPVSMKLLMGQ